MNISAILLLCIYASVTICIVPAQATTITFEDLKSTCDSSLFDYSEISSIYGGLNWNAFYAFDAPKQVASGSMHANGYVNGTVSGTICAFNAWNPAEIESVKPFILHSVYLTGAWNDGLSVQTRAYRAGVLIYSKAITVSYYHPTLVSYEWHNIDRVTWFSTGGVPVLDEMFGGGPEFAMDDLSYDFVPEQSSLLALFCGIGGLQVFRKLCSRNPA